MIAILSTLVGASIGVVAGVVNGILFAGLANLWLEASMLEAVSAGAVWGVQAGGAIGCATGALAGVMFEFTAPPRKSADS